MDDEPRLPPTAETVNVPSLANVLLSADDSMSMSALVAVPAMAVTCR
jgi:hypothetical protein